jgi:hypothetical protein
VISGLADASGRLDAYVVTALAALHPTPPLPVWRAYLWPLVGSLAVVLGSLTVIRWSLRDARSRTKPPVAQKALEDRIDELSKSMRDSARLVEQVSAELDVRAVTAKKLKEEADAAEALAGLHKEQTDAIRRMMDAELLGAAHGIRRDSIKIGIASFVAGGAVSFVVTLLVHPLR